ncbi:MAG: porin [Acidobacteriota bacterium]
MKKTLLALAALAATSAAFAQSSVTLYGVLDASVEKVKTDHQVTRVSSDNLATSRIGFKGTEDLGSGLKANFVLESAVKVDTGANGGGASRFFDRAAWVGLAGGAGELRLGRQDSSIGALAGDTSILGAQGYDDFRMINTRAGYGYRRVDNAITYILPQVVQGLTAQVQYSLNGGVPGTVGTESYGAAGNYTKNYGISVKYANGPLLAGLGYLNVVDDVAGAPDNRANATLVYGGYDLGAAKVIAYLNNETALTIVPGAKRLSLYGVKAIVPVSPDMTVQAGVSKAKNILGLHDAHDDSTITELKGIYKLSKRTSVYGLATIANNEAVATTAIGGTTAAAADKVAGGVAFGVSHAF